MGRHESAPAGEGNSHYDAGRWSEAGVAYERAIALQPAGSAQLWFRLGNVREEQGRDPEAAICFARAIALDARHARAWNNLGGARQRLGQPGAVEAYRQAIDADPELPQPRVNLGRLYGDLGEHALAAECFRGGLERLPDNESLAHLVAATSGKATDRAPQGYVTALFDGIAKNFERHLVQDLGYQVPSALAGLARPILTPGTRAIDLGCGTGLVGAALAGSGVALCGVDLSPRMLEIAQQHGHYARLVCGELTEVLASEPPRSVQALFAADVFIYIGDLNAVFAAAARVLAPGGLFVLSVEGLQEGDYCLRPTGRYAQSPRYLRSLAARHGLQERIMQEAPIRREGAEFSRGWLAMFIAA